MHLSFPPQPAPADRIRAVITAWAPGGQYLGEVTAQTDRSVAVSNGRTTLVWGKSAVELRSALVRGGAA